MNLYKISSANLSDLLDISELWVKLMKESSQYNESYKPTAYAGKNVFNYFHQIMKDENKLFKIIKAQFEERIIGFIECFVYNRDKRFLEIKGTLGNIYVVPEFRGVGLGKTMCESAAYWFKTNRVTKIELSYIPQNEKTSRFWKKMGIQTTLVTGSTFTEKWLK